MTRAGDHSGLRIAAAWGVHTFTASGALAGIAALISISAGDFHSAILWMMAALFIDAVDGMLARSVGVSRVLPGIDGRRLDDMVDYFNYVLVPAVFLVSAGMLVHWSIVGLPVLASAYGFSQVDAKTEDDFFLGFPSYWNIFAIYAWLLEIGPVAGSLWLTLLSLLVFIPLKYLYPSRMTVLWYANAGLSGACLLLVGYAVLDPPRARELHLVEVSLVYPALYFALSFWWGGLQRQRLAGSGGGAPKPQ